MPPLRTYVVDAFTDTPFKGNPAGVVLCPDGFLPDPTLLAIAAEMKHAETAFLVPRSPSEFNLRWFTPAIEVDLCGHATLAAAHILFTELQTRIVPHEHPGFLLPAPTNSITFHTRSGPLTCTRSTSRSTTCTAAAYTLDFPALPTQPATAPPDLLQALGLSAATFIGQSTFDYLIEVEFESIVESLRPDFRRLANIDARGFIVTAPAPTGSPHHITSRFFAPKVGIDEDPVTGSAHCALAPHYAPRFGPTLTCLQASPRTGIVQTRLQTNRVLLTGSATTFLKGEINRPPD